LTVPADTAHDRQYRALVTNLAPLSRGAAEVRQVLLAPAGFVEGERILPPLVAVPRVEDLKKDAEHIHTPTMNLKNAAFLALVGTLMLTVLLIANFIFDVLNVLRGLLPAIRLLTSFIYAFAGLGAVVFLYAFHKAQS
jgi:hypothetical protein